MRGPRPCPATAHERSASSRPALVTAHRTLLTFFKNRASERIFVAVASSYCSTITSAHTHGYVIFEVVQPVEFLLAVYDFNRAGYDFSMSVRVKRTSAAEAQTAQLVTFLRPHEAASREPGHREALSSTERWTRCGSALIGATQAMINQKLQLINTAFQIAIRDPAATRPKALLGGSSRLAVI
jgi:hypothetical protein